MSIAALQSGSIVGIRINGYPAVNTAPPLLSGIFEVGQVAFCSMGSWSGSKPITFTYQWKLQGIDIVGATSDSYEIVQPDDTKTLACLVTATNSMGSVSQLSDVKQVGSNWILNGGVWRDTGVWEDSAIWID